MAKKEKPKRKALMTADLEMVRISKYNVRYRVKNEKGMDLDLANLELDRKDFPVDDDFSMHFIDADLRSPDFKPIDPNEPIDEKGIKALEAKQREFRKFKNLKLLITEA